jgi:Cof subfamily protein (haloacid dehalogenase superfamily)
MGKLIFFDIDGTLWDEHMQIPESTKRAIAELKQNGHKTFLCSGRARGNIRSKALFDLGFDGVLAACGNHIEMDGKILYENLLDQKLVERVIRILEECHMPVVLEGPTHHWISQTGFENDPFVVYIFQEMGETALPLTGYGDEIRINKFSADILPDSDYARVKAEIGADLDFLEHEGNVVEFVPKGTSKATGIAWLCDYLHVDKDDTYAVGDSVNDLDMLQFVGHGIAMGNATEPTKRAAEYVTADIHDDGIYKAMKHFGLISQ